MTYIDSIMIYIRTILFWILFIQCSSPADHNVGEESVLPAIISEKVFGDSDDPAIWIHPSIPDSSLIVGTDKDRENGGIYVFHLNGKIDHALSKTGMKRVNNVDIEYGFSFANGITDLLVATERDRNMLRVFRFPEMVPVDNGGIPVFVNEENRQPMGVVLYKRPVDGKMYVIVSRKNGPRNNYLFQYLLKEDQQGQVDIEFVRSFGRFSGKKEIESIAVDDEMGFVYYSDEQAGIRKYYADPDKGSQELAFWGQNDFKEDNEGISIFNSGEGKGFILVSDQQANRFSVYPRDGFKGHKHHHPLLGYIPVSTIDSDGSEVTSVTLPGFEGGLFVAMSTDRTFHFYRWRDLAQTFSFASSVDSILPN